MRDKGNRSSWQDRLTVGFAVLVGVYFILLLFCRYAMQEYVPAQPDRMWWAALKTAVYIALGFVLLKGIGFWNRRREIKPSDTVLCMVLMLLTVVSRLAMFLLIQVPMNSDVKLCYDMAEEYARTGYFAATDQIVAVAPNIVLYIVLLGEVFKIFGCSLLVAQVTSLVFLTGSVMMIYLLAREFFSKRTSFFATLSFCLSPSVLLFSLMPSTESVAFFPYLAGMVLFLRALRKEHVGKRIGLAVACGLVWAFSNDIRSNALIAMISLSLWAVMFKIKKSELGFKRVAGVIAAVLVMVFAFGQGMDVIKNEVFQGKKSSLQLGWTLYEGLDNETAGGWRQENTDVLNATIANYPLDEVQKVLLDKAIERVSEYSPETWARLMLRKGVNIWIFDDYAYQTLTATNEDSIIRMEAYRQEIVFVVNETYKVLLMAVAVGLLLTVKKANRGNMQTLLFLLLPLVLMILWHSFATSIPRYHYYAMPNLILIACWCAQRSHASEGLGDVHEA